MNKSVKIAIECALAALIVLLAWLTVKSVQKPVKFNKEVAKYLLSNWDNLEQLKTCQLQRLNNLPTNVATSLAWKNYADAGLNIIHFKGKIAGKKTRIHFDTGARFNAVLPTSELTPTAYIEIPGADIEISDYRFKVDFIKPTDDGSEEPRLNASFLMGKKWVLDYEHRQLLILSQ